MQTINLLSQLHSNESKQTNQIPNLLCDNFLKIEQSHIKYSCLDPPC